MIFLGSWLHSCNIIIALNAIFMHQWKHIFQEEFCHQASCFIYCSFHPVMRIEKKHTINKNKNMYLSLWFHFKALVLQIFKCYKWLNLSSTQNRFVSDLLRCQKWSCSTATGMQGDAVKLIWCGLVFLYWMEL